MNNAKFHIQHDYMRCSVKLHLRFFFPDGSFQVAQPGELFSVKPDRDGIVSEIDREKLLPVIEMRDSEAVMAFQSLMDELWREGYRPKDIGTAGHLSATQKHLEGMRTLAFSAANVKRPEEK